jgi:hypothetical protein
VVVPLPAAERGALAAQCMNDVSPSSCSWERI